MDYYSLKLCGLTRQLPLVALGPKLRIASFNLLGDGELVEKIAQKMEDVVKGLKFDFLVGPEVKVVPLIQTLAVRLGKPRYIVLRKNITGYMIHPLTGKAKPSLVLNGPDAEIIKGKKVVIIDDVVTTGQTIGVATDLIETAGATLAAVITILKQGGAPEKIKAPFFCLGRIPFFPTL